jgi:hypothetical protein
MPLASRHLERETASTIVNQQPIPRSCVNPVPGRTLIGALQAESVTAPPPDPARRDRSA